MSEKKFIVKPGDSLSIQINRRKKDKAPGRDDVAFAPKGLIPLNRRDEYLGRRLRKKVGIRLYDMAQYYDENGALHDTNFNVPISPDLEGGSGQPSVPAPSVANYNALADLLFADGIDVETRYPQINDEWAHNFFPIRIYSPTFATILDTKYQASPEREEHWRDGKLFLSDDELNAVGWMLDIYGAFTIIKFGGTSQNKITQSRVYAAPHVSDFKLGKTAKIFLMPLILEWRVQAFAYDSKNYFYLANHAPLKRRPVLDENGEFRADLPELFEQLQHGYDSDAGWSTPAVYAKAQKRAKYIRDYGVDEQGYRYTYNFGWSHTSWNPEDVPPNAVFPHNGTGASGGGGQFESMNLAHDPLPGTLLAAIKQNDTWYYVWKWDGSNPEGGGGWTDME